MASADDIQSYEDEVKTALGGVKSQLSRISKGLVNDIDIDGITEKIDFAKSKLRMMDLTKRQLDPQEARKWTPIIKELESQVKDFEEQLMWKTGGRRLTQSDKQKDKYGNIAKDEETAIMYGREMQDRQHDLADQAIVVLSETEEKARDTAEKVKEQSEQMGRIDHSLREIDDELGRATRVMKRIGRRVLTDKYIMCLIVLVFLALIGVIVVATMKKKIHPQSPV